MNKSTLLDYSMGLVDELARLYQGWEGVRQLKGTPRRLVRMYQEFCWPPEAIEEELGKQFRVFENGFDEMLVAGPITVWVLCPHHLLPVELKVVVGCIPNGRVLGLSKFARIAEVMGRRPIMQEQYSLELAETLWSKLDPKGVALYITGRHGCLVSRGVRQDIPIVTSVIKGAFEEAPTRGEFFAIARNSL